MKKQDYFSFENDDCGTILEVETFKNGVEFTASDGVVNPIKISIGDTEIKYLVKKLSSLKPCIWQYNEWHNIWETSCDHAHVFIADGPHENNYKYCPYCGGELEV